MKREYSYKLRPAYSSADLLIEFENTGDSEIFLPYLLDLLQNNGFQRKETVDVWMNDEIWIVFSSDNGKIILSHSIWDIIFITGEHNQKDILRIDKILLDSGKFDKLKVNFDDYKQKPDNKGKI
jgi:hypothetical protein